MPSLNPESRFTQESKQGEIELDIRLVDIVSRAQQFSQDAIQELLGRQTSDVQGMDIGFLSLAVDNQMKQMDVNRHGGGFLHAVDAGLVIMRKQA